MSLPQWKGLFDWSMKYQDGTTPTQWDSSEYDPQKMKWLEGVLTHYMQDFAERMKQIKSALDTGVGKPAQGEAAAGLGTTAEGGTNADKVLSLRDKELLLDELMDIVSSIDYARDLHKVGGLNTLLSILSCPHPSLQWRAAEVVATCVQNNPPVQQWFLEGGVLPHLMDLLHVTSPAISTAGESAGQAKEDTVRLRVKGLLALSGLVRHCAPALAAAVQAGLPGQLALLCADTDQRVQRKALSLSQYVVDQQPHLAATLIQAGALDAATSVLQQQGSAVEGSDLRIAALGLITQLAQAGPHGWDAAHRCMQLLPCLAQLNNYLAALPPEEQESIADEQHAVSSVQALLAGPCPTGSGSANDHVPVSAHGAGHQAAVHVGEGAPGSTNSQQLVGFLTAP